MLDLILASASPRRADLLRSAGLRIRILPTNCDETPRPHEPAVAYARRIAEAKLAAALHALESEPDGAASRHSVLTADTVVWPEQTAVPLGKPRDRAHALTMLRGLVGRDHFVTTAWALRRPGVPVHLAHETTRVFMRSPGEAELTAYLDTNEWCDKAGGYGIQGHAAGLVTHLAGSYTNVVGLPLAQVLEALRDEGGPS